MYLFFIFHSKIKIDTKLGDNEGMIIKEWIQSIQKPIKLIFEYNKINESILMEIWMITTIKYPLIKIKCDGTIFIFSKSNFHLLFICGRIQSGITMLS